MMLPPSEWNRRILVIDDNEAIHEDFRKVLAAPTPTALDALEEDLFGDKARPVIAQFELHSAFQGEEGIEAARAAAEAGQPYAMAFVDVRMPPGIDGVETTSRLWESHPDLQVVLCSAYTDYSWDDVARRLGATERLIILRKPFDAMEVRQLAHALTEKWELLRESRQMVDTLERAVRERTFELEETNRRLAQEIADRRRIEAELVQSQKLEALGRMAAGIAHEINNPLSFVIANLQFLRDELASSVGQLAEALRNEIGEVFSETLTGATRIKRIVQDVKLFSRSHEQTLAAVDVRKAIEDCVSMVERDVRERGKLVLELEPVPQVSANEQGLVQVLTNLIVNASQALPEGDPAHHWVKVSTRADGGDVLIDVADNGAGIEPEHLHKIFEPFFTTKPVGIGTGLGLSICHGLITKFGGALTVDSTVGKGSTFTVRLVSVEAAKARAGHQLQGAEPVDEAAVGRESWS